MIVGFVIWSIVAGIFLCIGISSRKSEVPVGFYTFVKRPHVKNVRKYNHAVSVLWITVAVIFEIVGIPILFLEQNSPLVVPMVFAVLMLVLAMMVAYARIEAKYKL